MFSGKFRFEDVKAGSTFCGAAGALKARKEDGKILPAGESSMNILKENGRYIKIKPIEDKYGNVTVAVNIWTGETLLDDQLTSKMLVWVYSFF